MRRSVLGGSAALLLSGVLIVGPAGVAYAGPQDGIGWQYSESGNGYWRAPQGGGEPGGGGGGGPATVWKQWSSTDELVCPEDDEDFACAGDPGAKTTGIYCAEGSTGPRGLPEFAWIRWERDIENGEPTPWVGEDAGCDEPGEDDFIPMSEISYTVDYEVFQPLGKPKIDLAPSTRTFVNFPTIVSTDYPAGISAPAEVLSIEPTKVRIPIHIDRPGGGLDGQILATAGYTWSFEGGGTASGRGKPYVRGTSPKDSPGYYVTNVFGTTGTKTVTLTATWTGTVTVDLLDPEEIDPVVRASTATVDVVQSRTVLGAG